MYDIETATFEFNSDRELFMTMIREDGEVEIQYIGDMRDSADWLVKAVRGSLRLLDETGWFIRPSAFDDVAADFLDFLSDLTRLSSTTRGWRTDHSDDPESEEIIPFAPLSVR